MKIPKDSLEKLLQDTDKSRAVMLSLLEDQHLMVNELKESQLKYDSLFENAPVSIWEEDLSAVKNYIDKNISNQLSIEEYLNENPDEIAHLISLIKVVNVNQATLILYKAKNKETLFNSFDKIITNNSLHVFKNLLINLCNSVYEFETESVNKKIDGENFFIKLKYSIVKGCEDTWKSTIISIIDITPEKEFKEKLLQSEQHFVKAQAIAHFGNWYIDYKKKIVTRSKEIYKILEINEDDLKPTRDAFLQFVHKDDLKEYLEIFENSIKEQKPYEQTFRIITPKGKIKYILEKAYTFCDDKNELLRTVGTAQDITEKILAEGKVIESQIQYQVLFDNAPIALFEEDFTEVIKKLNELGANAENIHQLLDDQNLLQQCLQLVFVNNVNQESLKLFKAKSKEHFHEFLPNIFTRHAINIVKNIFIDINQGQLNATYETVLKKVDGEKFNALVRFSVLKYNKESGKIIFSIEDITLREKLLSDIEAQQENLKQAQKIALIGSFSLNHEDNCIIRSDEFYNIFEVTTEELPPREESFLSFVHPNDVEQLRTIFHDSLKNQKTYELKYRITTGKGNLKYIREKGNTFYNEQGKPLKTIGTLQDITEKVLFENELDKSRKFLENTLNSMTDGFVTLSKDWVCTYVNPQAARFLNKSVHQLKNNNIWDVFPENINQHFHLKCKKALELQEFIVFEEYFINQHKWFENRVFPTSEGLSIFFSDITERKNTEKIQKEALNIINNSGSVAFLWKNSEGWPVEYVSENIERVLGYKVDEFKSGTVKYAAIIHPDDLETVFNEVTYYSSPQTKDQFEHKPYRIICKNGDIKWVKDRTEIRRNDLKEVTHYQGFIDDITEQYQLEKGINDILNSVSKVTGQDYLKEITIQLSHVLGAEHTFIGLNQTENPLNINTIYNCYKGEIIDNFSYNLDGTPCADVLKLEACSFPSNVANLFPDDILLKNMEIEGYVGVPLMDSRNNYIGIMAGLYKKPIENPDFAESIIQLFSTRTSAELERLRTEEQLKKSETLFNQQLQQLNIAIDAVNDVVFMTNTAGVFTYINKAFTKLYGYLPEELIGLKTPRIIKSGLLSQEFYENLWISLFEKKKIDKEVKNKTKEGTIIDIESSLSSITNEEGEIIGFVAIQRDITEKIKQNKLLEESERKYRDLFEKSGDAYLLIKNNTFVDCNQAALNMVEFKGEKKDFLNAHPSQLSPPLQPDGMPSFEKAEYMMFLAKENGTHIFEWIHLKTDGTPFFTEVTLTHIISDDKDDIIHVTWRDITSKKIAEEQLKASEAEAWALFEEAPYPIWVNDSSEVKKYFNVLIKNGITNLRTYLNQNHDEIKKIADLIKITKVNKSSLAFYEVESKEELYRHISDFFVTESYDSFKEELIALFEGKLSYKSELLIRKLNGQLANISVTASVPEIYKHTLEKVIISFVDVTEQKRNEQTKEVLLNISKKVSEASTLEIFSTIVKNELSVLIDTSNFYIGLYNKENDTIHVPFFADILDDEFQDDEIFDAKGSATGYVIKTKKPLLANDEQIQELVKKGLIKQLGPNSEIWLGVPLFSKNEVIGAIAVQSYTNPNAFTNEDLKLLEIVSEQISIAIDRIKHQDSIKENEEKFRNIFELSPDMINLINQDGIVLDCNNQVVKQLGYQSKKDIIGKHFSHFFGDYKPDAAQHLFASVLNDGFLVNEEFLLKRTDGTEFSAELSSTLLKIDSTENQRIVSIARDITLRKQHELEITNALEKAKESDRLKSAFLANMSHEIRTPMNGIIGFAELLQDTNLLEDKRSFYANIIMNSSRQLLSIINDVLDMSTIEAGLVEIKKAPVSINAMLRELHGFFLQRSEEKQLKLTCELTLNDQLSTINTDQTKVQQVLTNFISNAIKFTKKGSVTFGYIFKDNFLEFYVTDTGIGIDKKLHLEIFERFRQVNMEYTRETIGNGLGLSISKKLVELLGGEIWIASETNKGSTFYFTLPYQHDVLDIKEDNIILITQKAMNEKVTILLAEDEEYNRIFIEEILDDKNFTILIAENGVEAVELAKNHPEIMFILMDIKMPVMNGIEALKIIREFNKEVPIIALTAFSMESDKTHLTKEGFDDYVAKPIVKKDLMGIIDKYVI